MGACAGVKTKTMPSDGSDAYHEKDHRNPVSNETDEAILHEETQMTACAF